MYKKLCSQCYQPSFSSSKSYQWICPVCSKDLTSHKAIQAVHAVKKIPLSAYQQNMGTGYEFDRKG
ncbi:MULTISPECIES: hypothetical protein [Metabacillus]|uniref:hypothetical protein n=1 Tax=Metabacillus TaxID=2675233 RepID=UPI000493479C|nr:MULTISPECIES: hypothetical protein [Metabacillus]KEZ50991.1 hypothetical protein AZ46_0210250 [Metabacillus indicus LMG 22858]MDX8291125.1 hypothetical protein [Metabacillus indicus]